MSLYSGIKFSDPEAARQARELAKNEEAAAISSARSEQGRAAPPKDVDAKQAQTGSSKDLAAPRAADSDAPSVPAPSSSSSSTAALRFAPVIRKKPVAHGQRSNVLAGPPVSALAALSKPTVVAAPSAAPLASSTNTQRGPHDSTASSGKKIMPPSLTLDEEDVNGFKQTAAGKKANKPKKKRKRNKQQRGEDPQLAFTSILYDPSRPCDYIAYKTHVEQKRAERLRHRSSESEYDTSDEDRSEDERTLKKGRFFAPPASYDSPPHETPAQESSAPPPPRAEAAATMAQETAEEAYQRRLAMSQRQTETGDEAYQRRLAMSQHPRQAGAHQPLAIPPAPPAQAHPSFVPSSVPPQPAGTVESQATTSTTAPLVSSEPSSKPALTEAAQRAREIAARLSKLGGAKPPINTALQPNPEKPDFIPGSTSTASSNLPPQPAPAEDVSIDDILSSLETDDATSGPDQRPFAQRIMAQWGYEKGKGLGKDETGMKRALRVETAAQQAKKKAQGSGGNEADNAMKGRGSIVDSTRKDRLAGEREKYGEPSRVVLLTNMCGLEDVDDDLPGEVAEEANKFGLVERVFIHKVPGEERPDEQVRIFLVILAGGYNAVRTFDQRFFAGRTVRARYYDEKMFKIARYDL